MGLYGNPRLIFCTIAICRSLLCDTFLVGARAGVFTPSRPGYEY